MTSRPTGTFATVALALAIACQAKSGGLHGTADAAQPDTSLSDLVRRTTGGDLVCLRGWFVAGKTGCEALCPSAQIRACSACSQILMVRQYSADGVRLEMPAIVTTAGDAVLVPSKLTEMVYHADPQAQTLSSGDGTVRYRCRGLGGPLVLDDVQATAPPLSVLHLLLEWSAKRANANGFDVVTGAPVPTK